MNLPKDFEFVADYLNGMIVQQILTVMEDEGITLSKLAEKKGLSWEDIHRLLTEKKIFTLEYLAKFCCALGCTVEVVIKKDIEG